MRKLDLLLIKRDTCVKVKIWMQFITEYNKINDLGYFYKQVLQVNAVVKSAHISLQESLYLIRWSLLLICRWISFTSGFVVEKEYFLFIYIEYTVVFHDMVVYPNIFTLCCCLCHHDMVVYQNVFTLLLISFTLLYCPDIPGCSSVGNAAWNLYEAGKCHKQNYWKWFSSMGIRENIYWCQDICIFIGVP